MKKYLILLICFAFIINGKAQSPPVDSYEFQFDEGTVILVKTQGSYQFVPKFENSDYPPSVFRLGVKSSPNGDYTYILPAHIEHFEYLIIGAYDIRAFILDGTNRIPSNNNYYCSYSCPIPYMEKEYETIVTYICKREMTFVCEDMYLTFDISFEKDGFIYLTYKDGIIDPEDENTEIAFQIKTDDPNSDWLSIPILVKNSRIKLEDIYQLVCDYNDLDKLKMRIEYKYYPKTKCPTCTKYVIGSSAVAMFPSFECYDIANYKFNINAYYYHILNQNETNYPPRPPQPPLEPVHHEEDPINDEENSNDVEEIPLPPAPTDRSPIDGELDSKFIPPAPTQIGEDDGEEKEFLDTIRPVLKAKPQFLF